MIVYHESAFIPEEEAKISFLDRGFLMGDGLYATIQVFEGKALFLKNHLDRVKAQSLNLGIDLPTLNEKLIYDLIDNNGAHQGIYKLKIVVSGGTDQLMRLPRNRAGSLLIFLKPFTPPPYKPLTMALYPETVVSPHSSFKSLAHLTRYFVAEYAHERKCDDALTRSPEGYLLEASFANIFWVEDETLFTPDRHLPLHFGVSISEAFAMVSKAQFVRKKLEEIPETACLYRINTMSGIRPIEKIEAKVFRRDLSLEKHLFETFEKRKLESFQTLFHSL